MRLARFNVLSRREEAASGQHKAPGALRFGLDPRVGERPRLHGHQVAHNVGFYAWVSQGVVAVIVLALSYLMVSRVHFRSFKDVRLTKRTVGLLTLLIGSGVVVALAGVDKAVVFLFLITAYILLGFTETMILTKRHFPRSGASATRQGRCRGGHLRAHARGAGGPGAGRRGAGRRGAAARRRGAPRARRVRSARN